MLCNLYLSLDSPKTQVTSQAQTQMPVILALASQSQDPWGSQGQQGCPISRLTSSGTDTCSESGRDEMAQQLGLNCSYRGA